MTETALTGCRILDLTDDKGALCGKMLGDLGADVIKVEPPAGDPSRNNGPFFNNISGPESSLYWFSLNTNKRSITLNLDKVEGRQIFWMLVKSADIIIESHEFGYLRKLGLDYRKIRQMKPGITMTSISPFGQDGPYHDYRISDLVAQAMSGFMYMIGDPDRPPVRICVPQAYLHAGGQAAAATSIAYYSSLTSGEGQYIDVAIHGAMTATTLNAVQFWDLRQHTLGRSGPYRQGLSTSSQQRELWKCKDGYVAFTVLAGVMGLRTNENTVKWMAEEGIATDHLLNMDWQAFDQAKATEESVRLIEEPIQNFFMSHTMVELFKGAVQRGIMLTPVATTNEIMEETQLISRQFWQEINHPGWGKTFFFPGPAAKLSLTPCTLRRLAPTLGEHNQEIYQEEFGISQKELGALRKAQVI